MSQWMPEQLGTDELRLALSAVASEQRLTTAFRAADHLLFAAALSADPQADAQQLAAVVQTGDDVSALAAVHALGAIADPLADRVLVDLVLAAEEPFAAHAAWALGARRSSPEAIAGLTDLVAAGGFTSMLAERTLIEWARASLGTSTVGLPGALPTESTTPLEGSADGMVIIQPFLHARLDRNGSALGVGDAGGIASLLRSLGTSLAGIDDVDQVVTVTRRQGGEDHREDLAVGHRVERIDIGPPGPLPWREAWMYRLDIEEAFMAIGRSFAGRRVVWHLRMADVGTLAAAAAARRLGQPMVFTAAPDPHIVIDALQDSGRLDRAHFAVEDAATQYWFRARMVERLTLQADRLALLPRPTIQQELVELLGIDPVDLAQRSTVIPEGVDIGEIDRAVKRLVDCGESAAVRSVLDSLPVHRRNLPWLLTVGRLNPAKGPQRIVEAVIGGSNVADLFNVIIVGGDIVRPSPDEQSTIEMIRKSALFAPAGMVTLTGHLPPKQVSDLLVYAASRGGVYVCGSDKEEFGLSIVEALAAGLVVVAPQRGGPRTYVVDGDTGVLCNTSSRESLTAAIQHARTLVPVEGRSMRAKRMVRDRLGIDGMATRLADVYRELLPAPVNV